MRVPTKESQSTSRNDSDQIIERLSKNDDYQQDHQYEVESTCVGPHFDL